MVEEFLYFDETSIITFASQIKGGRIDTFSEEDNSEKGFGGALRPRINMRSLFGFSWLFSGRLDAEGSYRKSNGTKKIKNYTHGRENKYQDIIEHLGGYNRIKCNLDQAWHRSLVKGSALCIIEDTFSPAYETSDWLSLCNEAQFFQIQDSQTKSFKIGMSYSKILGIREEKIHPASHLAARMRRGANLKIFGKMDKTRYIKPFVISWN